METRRDRLAFPNARGMASLVIPIHFQHWRTLAEAEMSAHLSLTHVTGHRFADDSDASVARLSASVKFPSRIVIRNVSVPRWLFTRRADV
jgi:hypothetical protein